MNQIVNQERELIGHISSVNVKNDTTLQCIQRNLEESDLVIDLIHLNYIDSTMQIQECYGAYIIEKDKGPILINLCQRQSLDGLVHEFNSDELYINELYTMYSDSLYNLLVAKLEPFIINKKRVYFRTTGLISRLNIEMIRSKEKGYVFDRCELYNVSDFTDANFKSAKQKINSVSSSFKVLPPFRPVELVI